MSVMLYDVRQYARMAAALADARCVDEDASLSNHALAAIFAIASRANYAAFRASYGERAAPVLARRSEGAAPFSEHALTDALSRPAAALDPSMARSDAALLLYNTIDNDGRDHCTVVERLALERVVELVIAACDRIERADPRDRSGAAPGPDGAGRRS